MRPTRRGVSLIELIFVIGLGTVVLSVGYRMYAASVRADQMNSRRHRLILASQDLMAKIKQDVRSADEVHASGTSLVLSRGARRVCYQNLPDGSGVIRGMQFGRAKYAGLKANFRSRQGGVSVRIWSDCRIGRRPVRIDVSSFISPRNQ